MTVENTSNLEDIKIPTGAYYLGQFDGKDRYVRFDLNAFAEMERIYGSMDAANEALTAGSMAEIRRVLWLGLIWNEAILDEITGEPIKYNLTMHQVGAWLTPLNMKAIMENLMLAMNGAMPKEETKQNTVVTPIESLNAKAEGVTGKDPN